MKFLKQGLPLPLVGLGWLLFMGALAGCGGGSDSPSSAGSPAEKVSVELKEWSITPDKATLAAGGNVTFKAKNTGTVAHELVILKTDLPVDALTVVDKKVEEEKVGTVINEIAEFAPGTEKEITLDLPAGSYVLFCNVEEHYQNGMRVAFTAGPVSPGKSALIDAAAVGLGAPPTDPKNKYAYFNFSTGQGVDLADAQAPDSPDWDIAFKRSSIKLNGGISGKKRVVGFFTGNNAEAYGANGKPIQSWFENATAETELPDFEGVTVAQIPADSEFKADKLILAIKGDGTNEGWWFYDGPPTHAVTAVPENWWVVKSAGGDSHAKFHVTLIEKTASERKITVEMKVQPVGSASFGDLHSHTLSIPIGGGAQALDFDAMEMIVDPSVEPGWDLKAEYDAAAREYRIRVNAGVSGPGKGGAMALENNPDSVTNGADRNQAPHYFSDSTGGIFSDVATTWNAYNITGTDHKLWPNFRVYLIKSGADVFKLQILGYYHPQTTESGVYTVRYEKVTS
ncbi:MAG: HmuY family protein [Candidatus Manganitrophaceae bacterium]